MDTEYRIGPHEILLFYLAAYTATYQEQWQLVEKYCGFWWANSNKIKCSSRFMVDGNVCATQCIDKV